MKTLLYAITALLIFTNFSLGQDTIYQFSLQQAIDYAVENNYQILNSKLDIEKAKWQVWQTTAMGLPQVKANVGYKQYPNLPTQLMPNFLTPVIVQVNTELFGLQPVAPLPPSDQKIPVRFGSEYNANYGITVNQLIFSGEYIIGLQAARIFKELTEQKHQKNIKDLKASVEQTYILALIAKQSLNILNETYQNTKKLRNSTAQLVATGMAEKIQLDQMEYLLHQLENQINTIERQYDLTLRLLKFQLGIDQKDSIILTDNLDSLTNSIKLGDYLQFGFNPAQTIDYRIIKTQEHLAKLDYRREQAKLLPQIMGFFTYSENAMRDEFNFLDKDQPWFKTTVFGFQVDIPLFSSGAKYASIKQKKIAYLQAQTMSQMMQQQLTLQYNQALSNFINAYEKLLNEQQNIELTKKVYQNTQEKYLAGAASSLELTQAQNQYLQAQANYYSALMQLIKAKTELQKFQN